jgi:hypothetical protein
MDSQISYSSSIDTFKISFGGQNSIDYRLFVETIGELFKLTLSSVDVFNPACYLRFDIQANTKGSFVTILNVVVQYLPDLLIVTNIASNVTRGVIDFFLIKQHLKGNKPKEVKENGNKVFIENIDGEVFETDANIGNTFLKNNKIDKLIINIGNGLLRDGREGFSMEAQGKELRLNRDNYKQMATPIIDAPSPIVKTEKQRPIEVNLLLKKPDLLGKSQWEFIYNKKICVKIQDEDFLQKVHRGEIKALYAGVRIPCLLEMEQDFDEYFNPIEDSDRYTILKVTGEIIEPKQNEGENFNLF